ncbi:hemin uptake protein HemP [Botrimarina hoheduenensis]|uniref:Hemin uptake protein hemP n=1 Tax=Botrimarina hoheduenensis TaxID=2528000 RepID=A0A5C5WCX9_9BACT|nr:hemin uptake protein HemP [Botrimarina hoheduenensis]TWT47522.1 Hemin uptake protein hemP [Botrimarina hoheduenensis]
MTEPSQPTNEPSEAVPVQVGRCPTAAVLTRTVKSSDLFGSARTVLIAHADEHYRLIMTKNGKLLLQK